MKMQNHFYCHISPHSIFLHISFFLGLWGIMFLIPNESFAQACCSGGTPLSGSTLGIQSMEASNLQIQLSYDYNTQRSLFQSSKNLDDNNRDRNTHSFLLRSSYAFNSKFSATGIFSFIQQEERNRFNGFDDTFTRVNGIGDVVLMLQYQVISKNNASLIFSGGIKAPIGSTDRVDPRTGIVYAADLQPGTGSWDYIGGVNFTVNNIMKNNLNFLTLFTYRLTNDALRFGGAQRYEFGDELQLLMGVTDSYVIGKGIFDPSLLIRYRHTGVDQSRLEGGNPDWFDTPNTSGNWLHLVPGIDWHLNTNIKLGISSEIPIYRNLNGTQLTTTFIFRTSISYNLSFAKKDQINLEGIKF